MENDLTPRWKQTRVIRITKGEDQMLFTVHFEEDGSKILMATFLFRFDAELFVAHSLLSSNLVVTEINKREAWNMIKGEIR